MKNSIRKNIGIPSRLFGKSTKQQISRKCTGFYQNLQSYRGTGIAAKLYYESKVAEALSLVVEYQKKRSVSDHKLVSQDLERIQTVAAYLSDHSLVKYP